MMDIIMPETCLAASMRLSNKLCGLLLIGIIMPETCLSASMRLSNKLCGLLMIGIIFPETCLAASMRLSNKFYDFCIWLDVLFEYLKMHGTTNPKFINARRFLFVV
jgi:Ca2+/H+ antiporter